MARPTKRKVHNTKIAHKYQKRIQPALTAKRVHALSFVFSIIACGLHYAKTALCFLLNDVIPPKKSTFYKLQKKVINVLCCMACESMNKEASKTRSSDVISVDGAWDHWRGGTECQAVFINQRTDKIVYVNLVTKQHGKVVGNFSGASGNMESEAIRRAVPQLKKMSFGGYEHDKDNRTKKIFSDNWKELDKYLDPNHAKKSLERQFEKYNTNNLLYGLKQRLIKWFYTIIKLDVSPKKAKDLWKNAEQHFCGHHKKCPPHKPSNFKWPNKNNQTAVKNLHDFLDKTSETIQKVTYNYSTNANESFNSLRTKYAHKNTAWQGSYRGRLAASILQKNNPYLRILDARSKLKLPDLSPETKKDLNQLFHTRLASLHHQQSPVYKNDRKLNRSNKYQKDNYSKTKKVDYKPLNHNRAYH